MRYLSNRSVANPDLPLLLCLHGNSSCAETFEEIIKRAPSSIQVIAPDLPGCGASFRLSEYSMQLVAAKIDVFISQFAHSRLYVFGHSLGGHLIAYLETSIHGIILSGTSPLRSADDFPLAFSPGPEERKLLPLLSKLESFTSEEATSFVSHTGVTGDMLQLMIRNAMQTDGAFRRGCLSTLASVDQRTQLEHREMSTLIFHARRDGVISADYLESLDRCCLWQGHIFYIDGPHMLPITNWKEMLTEIEAYCA